jgi:Zn-dependent protease with chaperone function/Tfp pilus assembly protein PilE
MNFALVYPGEKTRFAIAATLSIILWLALIVGTLGIALLYVLFFFLIYLFAQSAFISYLRGSAVKVTAEQFPDLHERVKACAAKVGLKQVPDAYLMHSDGFFNALATRFLFRDYIVLYSSVVDALASRPGAVNFYIGHELGHIHRGHLTWSPVLALAMWLPLLGAGLRRAEEYTCDRYGLACCESADDAKAGMAALASGHSRWPALNYAAYGEQRKHVTGFWGSYHEITSDYPWTAKRAFAIDELAQGREPKQPGRSALAYPFALVTLRVPGAGGAGMLVTIAMIGILAAIAIPAYQDYIGRATIFGVMSQAAPAKGAVEAFAMQNNQWPGELEQLQLEQTEFQINEKHTATLSLGENGQLLYRINGGRFKGEALVMTPEPIVEDKELKGVEWHCGSEELDAKLLPAACR